MIHLLPEFGLCNRMRSIDSAIALAKKLELSLKIYWVKDKDINCRFSDLFLPVDGVEIIETNKIPFLHAKGGKQQFYLPNMLRKGLNRSFYSGGQVNALVRTGFNFEKLSDIKKPIHLNSYSRFYESNNQFKAFRPVPEIREAIDEETKHFNSETIGVHIRRSDHIRSIQHSTLKGFIQQMDAHLHINPAVNFYLASDDIETKKLLKHRNREKVFTNFYPADRSTTQGMKQAVTELFALANTSKIFGSYLSSFSQTASSIYNIEHVQIYSPLNAEIVAECHH